MESFCGVIKISKYYSSQPFYWKDVSSKIHASIDFISD